jgi:hypothetical protein
MIENFDVEQYVYLSLTELMLVNENLIDDVEAYVNPFANANVPLNDDPDVLDSRHYIVILLMSYVLLHLFHQMLFPLNDYNHSFV